MKSMLVFKHYENLLLLPPRFFTTTTTNSKPHHLLHLHLHLHHHHDVKLHFPTLKAHIKSITLSSSSSPPPPSDTLPPVAAADSLMDSGGLSYVEAIQVIPKKPSLLQDGGRKPRSVIAYFESVGFSKTQISKVIYNLPGLLVVDVEQTLKPKIQLFLDFGLSGSDIAELISSNPTILRASLENQIKPGLELLKSFVQTREKDLIKIIKRKGNFLSGFRKSIEANITVLREDHGVQDSEILYLILTSLSSLMTTPKVFKSVVERVASFGFEPETKTFSIAVSVMSRMSKPIWDSKVDLLMGLGWSEVQILTAIRKRPSLFTISREKLKEGIDFFCKESSLNWDASFLSQSPYLLTYSLKKRVIPRYAVYKCLISKEIIKEDRLFRTMLKLTETRFLSKYIFNYQHQIPYLHEVYMKECMLGYEEEDNGEITTNQQDNGDVDDMTV